MYCGLERRDCIICKTTGFCIICCNDDGSISPIPPSAPKSGRPSPVTPPRFPAPIVVRVPVLAVPAGPPFPVLTAFSASRPNLSPSQYTVTEQSNDSYFLQNMCRLQLTSRVPWIWKRGCIWCCNPRAWCGSCCSNAGSLSLCLSKTLCSQQSRKGI